MTCGKQRPLDDLAVATTAHRAGLVEWLISAATGSLDSGLPQLLVALAGAISVVMMAVFWKGYRHVSQAGRTIPASLPEVLEVVVE